MAYHSFEELDVWKRSCRQSVEIFKEFENCRNHSLRTQIERAGLSVPSNIAEGCERNTPLDFRRFLRIALGSNAELRTQLYISRKLELIDSHKFSTMVAESKEISAMIQGLWNSLKTTKS